MPSDAAPVASPAPAGPGPQDVVTIQPHTIQAAVAAGVKPGDVIAAPLAPKTGPITVVAAPVAASTVTLADGSVVTMPAREPLVVVTVREFWTSQTGQAIRKILISIGAALALVLGGTFTATWTSGKSIFEAGAVNWKALEIACEIAAGGILVTAIMAWARKHDNSVVAS
jgi:hypothetical protein